jgi:hypothetical protein
MTAAPIVIDTGASLSVSPFLSDFVRPIQPLPASTVCGFIGNMKIEGVGQVRWIIKDADGNIADLETTAYYIPQVDVRLFSPQVFLHHLNAGSLTMDSESVHLHLPDATNLWFLFEPSNNLPIMLEHQPTTPTISFANVSLDLMMRAVAQQTMQFDNVLSVNNPNITMAQKGLLGWHWCLDHVGFHYIQWLMWAEDNHHPFLSPKHAAARTCTPPLCAACSIACAKHKGAGTSVSVKLQAKEMTLQADHLEPGSMVSLDQYISSTLGCLPHTQGKEWEEDQYHGGTIAINHATSMIWIRHQVSLHASETLQAKHSWERYAYHHGIIIKGYHTDNRIFSACEFLTNLDLKQQTICFSGIAKWCG